jgi:hypothetical protein
MANPTTNLGMTKPTVGGSTDTWGTTINENVVDIIDALFSISGTDVTMSDIKFNSMSVQETGAGTDTVKIQAPAAVTQYTLTMPGAVGASGQALRASDGAGVLEWYTPADVGDITSVVAGAGMTGGGSSGAVTLNVIGTADKITVSADALTISSTYVGQTSIVTLGTIATGTWEGTTVAVNQGGTGATSLTDGGVLLGSGTGAITATSVLGDGEILIGDASGDPATLDVGSSTAITILGTVATGVWNATAIANAYLANSTVSYGGVSLALGASDATPAFNLSNATAYTGDSSLVTVGTVASGTWNGSTVAVAYGGTGATTFTDGGVLLGSGTGAITATAVLGNGEILIGDASGDPVALDVGSSTAITILGTVATGVWNGTAITGAYIDPTSSPLADTKIWIGSASNVAAEFALSGDATMTAGGAVTVSTAAACTGLAATATALATARAINGTDFDGTAAITVTAAAGTLTGTALKSTVVTSSLTAVGTIATGAWNAGAVTSSGDVTLSATNKVYLDGGTHTYIAEFEDNKLEFVTNGVRQLSLAVDECIISQFATFNGAIGVAGNVSLATTKKVILDSATNTTWISEYDTNKVEIVTNSVRQIDIMVDETIFTQAATFEGSVSKASGSFKIDHPLPDKKDTHHLVHSFHEGPRADLWYRGEIALVSGSATVDLDEAAGMSAGTWDLLCRDPQVWIQNDSGWDAVRGSVSGSTLTIECSEAGSSDTVSWMVVAERHDQHMIDTNWTDDDGRVIVEPEKTLAA